MVQRYFWLYGLFLRQRLTVYLAYRINFLIGAASTIIVQTASLAGMWVVMQNIPSLNGWHYEDLLLVYGLTMLAKGLSHMLGDGLWVLGRQYVQNGDLDRLLVRPINPLFHLIANRFGHEGIGTLIIGILLVGRAATTLGLTWGPAHWLYIGVSILTGTGIFIGINLITAATAFWIIDSVPLMWGVFETHEFVKYPLAIYGKTISLLLTWVIPYGFVSFYPASYLLGRGDHLVWGAPVMAIGLLLIGYRLWSIGLSHYTGTGS